MNNKITAGFVLASVLIFSCSSNEEPPPNPRDSLTTCVIDFDNLNSCRACLFAGECIPNIDQGSCGRAGGSPIPMVYFCFDYEGITSSSSVYVSSARSSSSIRNNSSSSVASSSSVCVQGNGSTEVCNGISYNTAREFCADDNKVYDKCGCSIYNPPTQFCSLQDTKVYDKCGNSSYDIASQGCCGNKTYTLSTQECIENTIFIKCGSGSYESSEYGCCNGIQYLSSTHFCNSGEINEKCDGREYNATQYCFENKVYDRCGGAKYNPNTDFCSGSIVYKKCNGIGYDINTHYCSNGTSVKEYGYVTHGGQKYKTVIIDNLTWTAENLNYNISGSVCYNDLASNCNKYGRLYNWDAAIIACPVGWRLPTNDEWDNLHRGGKIRATNGWDGYTCNSLGCDDTYGFLALPGGRGIADNVSCISTCTEFSSIGSDAYWWSSIDGYAKTLGSSDNIFNVVPSDSRKLGLYSIRCVKN